MTSSKNLFMIAVIVLILSLIFPIQSMPTHEESVNSPIRHKRWTFNTWRLHGRRQLSNDFNSPKALLNDEHQYQTINDEDALTQDVHEQLPYMFRHFNRE